MPLCDIADYPSPMEQFKASVNYGFAGGLGDQFSIIPDAASSTFADANSSPAGSLVEDITQASKGGDVFGSTGRSTRPSIFNPIRSDPTPVTLDLSKINIAPSPSVDISFSSDPSKYSGGSGNFLYDLPKNIFDAFNSVVPSIQSHPEITYSQRQAQQPSIITQALQTIGLSPSSNNNTSSSSSGAASLYNKYYSSTPAGTSIATPSPSLAPSGQRVPGGGPGSIIDSIFGGIASIFAISQQAKAAKGPRQPRAAASGGSSQLIKGIPNQTVLLVGGGLLALTVVLTVTKK